MLESVVSRSVYVALCDRKANRAYGLPTLAEVLDGDPPSKPIQSEGTERRRLHRSGGTTNTAATVIDQAPSLPTSKAQTTSRDARFQAARGGIADPLLRLGSSSVKTFFAEQLAATTLVRKVAIDPRVG